MARPEVEKNYVTWNHRGRRVPVVTFDNRKVVEAHGGIIKPSQLPLIILSAYGEGHLALKKVGAYLDAYAVGIHLPFTKVSPDDIEAVCREVPHVVAAHLQEQTNSTKKLQVIAGSAGGEAIGITIGEHPDTFGDLALVFTAGLHKEKSYVTEDGQVDRQALEEDRDALFDNLKNSEYRPKTREEKVLFATFLRRFLYDTARRRFKPNLESLLTHTIQGNVIRHVVDGGNRVIVFQAERDTIFPENITLPALFDALATVPEDGLLKLLDGKPKLIFKVVEGAPHMGLSTQRSKPVLDRAVEFLQAAA